MASDEIARQFRMLAAKHFAVYPEESTFERLEEGLRKRAERTAHGIRVTIWSAAAGVTPLYDSLPH